MPGPRRIPGSGGSAKVAAVVLAAGGSSRLGKGRLKQLLRLGDESLVRRATRAALASRARETVVVVGCEAERVRAQVDDLPCRVVVNEAWRDGQSTSVKTGLAAVSRHARAALFLPCDQPALEAELLDRLIETFERTGAPAVHPVFRNRRGSPTLIARDLFPELEALRGDVGGRIVLLSHGDRIVTVELDDPAPLLDVDTESAWKLLLQGG